MTTEHKPSRLLDLRFVIALMFLIFGVLVTLSGFEATTAEIDRAGGINISLWAGLAMLVLSGVFWLWLIKAPIEVATAREEIEAERLDEEWGDQEVPPPER
jgi:membrane protein YdbS with pleckstrin-like domain